jgi:hypothetical protein
MKIRSRIMRRGRHTGYTEEERDAFNILVRKFEETALGKSRRRKEENVKMGVKEIGCDIMQLVHPA